jgi:hypothetical protein
LEIIRKKEGKGGRKEKPERLKRKEEKKEKERKTTTGNTFKVYQFPSEFPANGRVLYFAHKYSAKAFGSDRTLLECRGKVS